MDIRMVRPEEHEAWLELRALLWPEHTREVLKQDQARNLRDASRNTVIVAVLPDGKLMGSSRRLCENGPKVVPRSPSAT